MRNQAYQGTSTSRRFNACPVTVKSNDAVLIGTEPAFAMDDYQANLGGTVFEFNGTFRNTVIARSTESPVVTKAILPGDPLYAVGTLDAVTNVTTSLTIDANSATGKPFGNLDPSEVGITAGSTNTNALVRI